MDHCKNKMACALNYFLHNTPSFLYRLTNLKLLMPKAIGATHLRPLVGLLVLPYWTICAALLDYWCHFPRIIGATSLDYWCCPVGP